jgi:hypothetical protein
METLLGGVLFVMFLIAQVTAVAAIHGERYNQQSRARDEIERDREAKAILYSAP